MRNSNGDRRTPSVVGVFFEALEPCAVDTVTAPPRNPSQPFPPHQSFRSDWNDVGCHCIAKIVSRVPAARYNRLVSFF